MIIKVALSTCLLLIVALAAVGCDNRKNWDKCHSSDPDTRIAGCTALIESGRTNNLFTPYTNRGAAYVDKKDYDHAIQDYNEAIRLNPNVAYPYYGRGEAYDHKGDFDRAIQDHNEAIRLNPNFAYAYDARGRAYRNKGDLDRAIQDYDEAIHLNPNFALAYNNRGDSYRSEGDYDRAIQDFTEAIRLNPNLVSAFSNRGFVYSLQLNMAAAIEDYEHVIAAAPSSNAAVIDALWLHVAMKRQGHDDAQLLARVAGAADLSKWPGPALKLDLGQMTADDVMSAAAKVAGASTKWQICEANYFIGEDALFSNQRTVAMARLKAARDGCPKTDGAYAAALSELKRLDSPLASAK